jgi:hypothetical protein
MAAEREPAALDVANQRTNAKAARPSGVQGGKGIGTSTGALWLFLPQTAAPATAARRAGAGNAGDNVEAPTFAGMRSIREVGARRGRMSRAQPHVNTS